MTYQSFLDSASQSITYGYGKFANPTPQAGNSQLTIGSWTDAIIVQSSNTLVIPQGYQVQLMASFYTERLVGTTGSNFCNMRWYDETNSTYIGMQSTVDNQWTITSPPNVCCNAALAFVDTSAGSITVSCKMSSFSATTTTNISGQRFFSYGSQSWLTAITSPV